MVWYDLLLGRPTLVIATIGLTLVGLTGNSDRPWLWIFGLASFIVLHSVVNWLREKSISGRLGRSYEIVQRRVLRLISDLSNLTAREYDLWMVDLYLPRRSFALSVRRPLVVKLVRELSLALTDVRTVPFEIRMDHKLFGQCFSQPHRGFWWDVNLAQPSSEVNLWHEFEEMINDQLRKTYGAISVNPVVDNLGNKCCGLLVVHTERNSEVATKALGALTQSEGIRRLAGACEDIHSHICK